MSEKEFDAVKMMREIRDKLSKEFENMSYEEQKRYITEKKGCSLKTLNRYINALRNANAPKRLEI